VPKGPFLWGLKKQHKFQKIIGLIFIYDQMFKYSKKLKIAFVGTAIFRFIYNSVWYKLQRWLCLKILAKFSKKLAITFFIKIANRLNNYTRTKEKYRSGVPFNQALKLVVRYLRSFLKNVAQQDWLYTYWASHCSSFRTSSRNKINDLYVEEPLNKKQPLSNHYRI
jgi:hypothetical protein